MANDCGHQAVPPPRQSRIRWAIRWLARGALVCGGFAVLMALREIALNEWAYRELLSKHCHPELVPWHQQAGESTTIRWWTPRSVRYLRIMQRPKAEWLPVVRRLDGLWWLEISTVRMTADELQSLARHRQLENVELHWIGQPGPDGFAWLTTLPKLQVLKLSYEDRDDDPTDEDAILQVLSTAPALEELHYSGILTPAGVQALTRLPRLKLLYLGETLENEAAIREFLSYPQLRELNVTLVEAPEDRSRLEAEFARRGIRLNLWIDR